MHVDQEFAAVLSLLLGVRMRSGGTIRRYGPDDLAGRTDLFEHVVPTLPPRAWSGRPIVRVPVGGQERVPLDNVVPRVADLRLASALHAVTMVRAASVFSDALWVCDHDSELAHGNRHVLGLRTAVFKVIAPDWCRWWRARHCIH